MPFAYDLILRAVRSNPLTHSLATRLQRLIPDSPVTRDLPRMGTFRFRLRRHRWMLGANPFGGVHDLSMQTFRQLIKPGDVLYDIGANVGYYTRLIAQELPVSKIVCFEPMRENVELLRANVALGKLDEKAIVFDLALSDRDGQEQLQIDDVMGGSAALTSVTGGEASTQRQRLGLRSLSESVQVRRLDALVVEKNLPLPNVMKIDVEGAEAAVLRGARETILKSKPRFSIALHGPIPTRETFQLLSDWGATIKGYVSNSPDERTLTIADAERLGDNNIVAEW